MKERDVAILFRNNHFSCIYKRNRILFELCTDEGIIDADYRITWQTLSGVYGDTHYAENDFRIMGGFEIGSGSQHYEARPGSSASTAIDITGTTDTTDPNVTDTTDATGQPQQQQDQSQQSQAQQGQQGGQQGKADEKDENNTDGSQMQIENTDDAMNVDRDSGMRQNIEENKLDSGSNNNRNPDINNNRSENMSEKIEENKDDINGIINNNTNKRQKEILNLTKQEEEFYREAGLDPKTQQSQLDVLNDLAMARALQESEDENATEHVPAKEHQMKSQRRQSPQPKIGDSM